jgi:hypothetical protein
VRQCLTTRVDELAVVVINTVNMSSHTTQRDLQNTLVIAAAYMQSLSLSQQTLELDTNEAPELALDNLEADDKNIPNSAPNYQRTSAGLIALATSLSGPGSREPYDQIDKCTTWFTTAPGWPDPDFRHTFR